MKLETMKKKNGGDTARLQETVSNVKASPELGRFKFQIANRWIGAGETRSEVKSFYGCGQDNSHKTVFHLAADEPDILLGRDKGANPVEHLLHALVSCVTTSMGYHARREASPSNRWNRRLTVIWTYEAFSGLIPQFEMATSR